MARHRPLERTRRRRGSAGGGNASDLPPRDPCRVLSDILDRRKFLIIIQLLLAGASICLMLLSATGLQTITSLIAFTFVGGIGAALMAPTWQAIVPELVQSRISKVP
jgi:MFS family permease